MYNNMNPFSIIHHIIKKKSHDKWIFFSILQMTTRFNFNCHRGIGRRSGCVPFDVELNWRFNYIHVSNASFVSHLTRPLTKIAERSNSYLRDPTLYKIETTQSVTVVTHLKESFIQFSDLLKIGACPVH